MDGFLSERGMRGRIIRHYKWWRKWRDGKLQSKGMEAPLLYSRACAPPNQSPFPKLRSHFNSLTLRPFHTSYGRPVQIGSTEAPANL